MKHLIEQLDGVSNFSTHKQEFGISRFIVRMPEKECSASVVIPTIPWQPSCRLGIVDIVEAGHAQG